MFTQNNLREFAEGVAKAEKFIKKTTAIHSYQSAVSVLDSTSIRIVHYQVGEKFCRYLKRAKNAVFQKIFMHHVLRKYYVRVFIKSFFNVFLLYYIPLESPYLLQRTPIILKRHVHISLTKMFCKRTYFNPIYILMCKRRPIMLNYNHIRSFSNLNTWKKFTCDWTKFICKKSLTLYL